MIWNSTSTKVRFEWVIVRLFKSDLRLLNRLLIEGRFIGSKYTNFLTTKVMHYKYCSLYLYRANRSLTIHHVLANDDSSMSTIIHFIVCVITIHTQMNIKNETSLTVYHEPVQSSDPSIQQPRPVLIDTVIYNNQVIDCICPYCHRSIVPRVEKTNGLIIWLSAGVICLLGCVLGCCLIPFFIDDLKVRTIKILIRFFICLLRIQQNTVLIVIEWLHDTKNYNNFSKQRWSFLDIFSLIIA
jgi:hypothetical protein